MKIAVDIMSGENAPEMLIKGAVDATKEFKANVILVGDAKLIENALKIHSYVSNRISVVHASEVITMNESPTTAIKEKQNSSVFVAAGLVKKGVADAFVSPGNTGATFAAAYMNLGRLKGVARPAILAHVPKKGKGYTILLDVGANPECKPIHLVQFAAMGEIYARTVMGIKKPTIGLLSNGSETSKGTEITRKAYKVLNDLPLNFIGYIEGRDIFSNSVDVAICDGFLGNVLLKTIEGLGITILKIFKEEIDKSALSKIGAMFMVKSFHNIKKKMDYAEYGGAPLIGLNGISIVTHGNSNDKEIKNGIRVAVQMLNYNINNNIIDTLREYKISKIHWFKWE